MTTYCDKSVWEFSTGGSQLTCGTWKSFTRSFRLHRAIHKLSCYGSGTSKQHPGSSMQSFALFFLLFSYTAIKVRTRENSTRVHDTDKESRRMIDVSCFVLFQRYTQITRYE